MWSPNPQRDRLPQFDPYSLTQGLGIFYQQYAHGLASLQRARRINQFDSDSIA